jgi:hypothetical protein
MAAWFGSFKKYRQGDSSDAAGWLEMHRAGMVIVDRLGRGTVIVPRAGVSVTGTIQPAILRRAFSPEHRESGLAARLLVAMPPAAIKKRPTTEVHPDTERSYEDLIDTLLRLDFNGKGEPIVLHLTKEASEAWNAFYDEFAIRQNEATDDLKAALAKLEGYAGRLALLFATISALPANLTPNVDAQSVKDAVELTKWFAYESERVYSILAESETERVQRGLIDLIQSLGNKITVRQLHRLRPTKYRKADEARCALEELTSAGLGHWMTGPKPARGPAEKFFELVTCHDKFDKFDMFDGFDTNEDETRQTCQTCQPVNESTSGYLAPGITPEDAKTPFEGDAAA